MHTESQQILSASSQSCSVACMSLSLTLAVFQTYLLEIYLLCLGPAANTNIISPMKLFFVSPESFWWQFVSWVWLQTQAGVVILRLTASSVCLSVPSPTTACISHSKMSQQQQNSNSKHFVRCQQQEIFLQNTSGAFSACEQIFLGAPEGV